MAAKYHAGEACKCCLLCNKEDTYYDHFISFKSQEKDFISNNEARRHHDTPGYIPKWKRERVDSLTQVYAYPKCEVNSDDQKLVCPSFQPIHVLQEAIGVHSIPSDRFHLCSTHYQRLYRQYNSPEPCHGCGINPSRGTHFTRRCPDPESISTHFIEIMHGV